MRKRLCVWNLSPETTPEDLYSLFGQVARVISIDIPTVPGNGQSMELGFVEIETVDLSRVIRKVLITELDGQTLEVCESLPRQIARRKIEIAPAHDGTEIRNTNA
jgi:RNA recognition motif-containing protein